MRIVVTGGTGFFGRGIVERLAGAGHQVIAASRRASGPCHLDVADASSCRALMEAHPGTDAVVHAAALAHVRSGGGLAAMCDAINVQGTRHMLDAALAAGVSRFVFISSVTVYGDYALPVPVIESTPPRVASVYGAAKRQAEALVEAAPIATWILRMSTMYAPDWLLNIRKRVAAPVPGNRLHFTLAPDTPRYTLCSRRNGAEAVLWTVEGRIAPGTYNVSERHVYSQREILDAVRRVDGRRTTVHVPVVLPRMAAKLAGWVPSASIRHNALSRYWKFCEPNVYSSDKLAAAGLILQPDLLDQR